MAARKRLLHQHGKSDFRNVFGAPSIYSLRSKLLCMISNNFFNKDVNANRCVSGLIGKLFILPMRYSTMLAWKTIFLLFRSSFLTLLSGNFLEFVYYFGSFHFCLMDRRMDHLSMQWGVRVIHLVWRFVSQTQHEINIVRIYKTDYKTFF